jgi:glycosyltransferase involved in cell wall biosynthesis
VDDGSDYDVAAIGRGLQHPTLSFIRKSNGGPASARNLGIQHATGSLVAFTDDDCRAIDSWPWPLAYRLEAEDSDVAGVGGAVIPENDGFVSRYCTLHRILEPPRSLSYLVTANCIFRKSALLEIGGFDEVIRSPGG